MNRFALLLVLAACTPSATTADAPAATRAASPAPAPITPAAPAFDTSLLCRDLLEVKAILGDPSFGTTESDPPAPSKVGPTTYSFAAARGYVIDSMSARLAELGGLTLGGRAIPADATLDGIVALGITGCGDKVGNDGADVLECTSDGVRWTFVAAGPSGRAPIEVRAVSASACGQSR